MFKKLFNKSEAKKLSIYAPVDGEILPITEVPDPVFSEKMMGEGIAVVPAEGKIYAPVAGKIVNVAPTKHAVGIEAENGSEILIHIGLETVALDGEGFDVAVSVGDTVSVGDVLVSFDLDQVASKAKSMVTPIVITNSQDGTKTYEPTAETVGKKGETVLMTVSER